MDRKMVIVCVCLVLCSALTTYSYIVLAYDEIHPLTKHLTSYYVTINSTATVAVPSNSVALIEVPAVVTITYGNNSVTVAGESLLLPGNYTLHAMKPVKALISMAPTRVVEEYSDAIDSSFILLTILSPVLITIIGIIAACYVFNLSSIETGMLVLIVILNDMIVLSVLWFMYPIEVQALKTMAIALNGQNSIQIIGGV